MKIFIGAIVIASLALVSCKENTQVNLVSGKVFENCAQPLASTEIALKSNVGGSFSAPIILGSGITAPDGTLNFTYELEEEDLGTGSLLLIKSSGFEVLLDNVELNQDVDLTLYRNDLSTVKVQLAGTRTFSLTDTLYYSTARIMDVYQKVQPVNGIIDSLTISSSNPNADNQQEVLYYGVGLLDFRLAEVGANIDDSTYNKLQIVLNGCGTETVVNLIIN